MPHMRHEPGGCTDELLFAWIEKLTLSVARGVLCFDERPVQSTRGEWMTNFKPFKDGSLCCMDYLEMFISESITLLRTE